MDYIVKCAYCGVIEKVYYYYGDFEKQDGTPFTSKEIGIDVPVWDQKAKEK